MNHPNLRCLILALCVGAAAVSSAACYGYVGPAGSASVEYEPLYYSGSVVYYDSGGRPYYYGSTGATVFIGGSDPLYNRYVDHYHRYGPAYNRWYQNRGGRASVRVENRSRGPSVRVQSSHPGRRR